eukprot:TRINITY_DN30745_c0_g1_i1.p2 TRINITY_DN30745_c0_g1~~TRINITY_DN30745_c0_g1_i1.p2  ORF type:complete len:203 (-),score=64.17 TRINITY_DN30745_c0_g1_i1:654-1262(-)
MAGDMLLILPVMYIMNQIDWTQPQNVLYSRILYGLAQTCILGFCFFIYQAINARKDQKKITVKQAAQWGTPAGPDQEQTVQEYDLAQLKKYATQVLFGACMVSFIHFKWGMIQPLFIQTVMTPMQLYRNQLFQIFVMGQRGDIEKRPFKEENPFAAAFSGMAAATEPEPAAESQPAQPEPETLTDASPSGKRKKSGKAKHAE